MSTLKIRDGSATDCTCLSKSCQCRSVKKFAGYGIDANIKQLYNFLVSNYDDSNGRGDEIYLFGFSRGAYTVRSLAGFISHCGLLHRRDLSKVHKAYNAYRKKLQPDDLKKYAGIEVRKVNVTLLACFDTVGALGVPSLASNWETCKYFLGKDSSPVLQRNAFSPIKKRYRGSKGPEYA